MFYYSAIFIFKQISISQQTPAKRISQVAWVTVTCGTYDTVHVPMARSSYMV